MLGPQQRNNRQVLYRREVVYVATGRNAAADSDAAESVQQPSDKGDITRPRLPQVYRNKERMPFGV